MLRAYAGALSPELLNEMVRSEGVEVIIDNSTLSALERSRSTQLFYILAMLCRGRSQDKLANVGTGLGYELWRQLCLEYEPKVRVRQAGLLVQTFTYNFGQDDIISSLELWERLVKSYETALGQPFGSNVKARIVVSRIKVQMIAQHLLLNQARLDTYEKVRAEVIDLKRIQRHMGVAPMQVDALTKGPGGKGGDKKCKICNKKKHEAKDCWYKTAAKGLGGGRGKGKGKDGGKG